MLLFGGAEIGGDIGARGAGACVEGASKRLLKSDENAELGVEAGLNRLFVSTDEVKSGKLELDSCGMYGMLKYG